MKVAFTQKLKGGTPVIGTIVTIGSPEVAEVLAQCGYDWLFLDMEHGCFEPSAVQAMLQAIPPECNALVRIPECSAAWFKKALDCGADGVIVPLVNTVEDARRAVEFAKYPPVGARSVGIGRAHGYGMRFKEYVEAANDSVALIIQIEHARAVENIDAILATPGIDGVLIGPYDLSASMGLMGQVQHARVREAISLVRGKCRAKNIPVGGFSLTIEGATEAVQNGCSFVAVGTDMTLLSNAAKNSLAQLHSGPGKV